VAPSYRRPSDRLARGRAGLECHCRGSAFSEGIVEALSVTLLLSCGFLRLTLASHVLIGGACDRGEIIEIRAQALAPRSD